MRFAEPSWLWVGAVASLLVIVAFVLSERRRARALARFVAARHLSALTESVSGARRLLKHTLFCLGFACIFVALARPQWGYHFQTQRSEGLDLIFAVDTSKSMLAADVRPSRLIRAKLAVEDLLDKLPGDRIGLVAFAGDAFLQTPLTLDRVAFRSSLDALDTELIPVGGTDLGSAIRVTEQAFGNEAGHRKILILLTDGEDLSGSALNAARDAAAHGVTVFPIGIGTTQGASITVHDDHGVASLLRDPNGELVHSSLDEAALRDMARITHGSYHALGQSGQGLRALYRDSLAQLPKQQGETRSVKVFYERFQWPLGAGIALLLFGFGLNDHRRRGMRQREAVVAALAALVCMTRFTASAQDRPEVSTYNQASSDYRGGHFDAAAEHYRSALKSRDLSLQERAYYDLGNAQYRQGQAAAQNLPAQMERYKGAIASYEAALALNGHDADAKFNRDFVRGKLKALEQQQQQKQPKQDQQSKQDQKSGQGQQAKQDQQSGQGQQSKQDQQSGQGRQSQQAQQGQQPKQGQQGQQTQQGQQPQQGQPSQPGAGTKPDAQASKANPPGTSQQANNQPGQVPQPTAAAANGGQAEHGAEPGKPAVPGGLTHAEATRLLDSLEGELQQLPSGYDAQKTAQAQDPRVTKDW